MLILLTLLGCTPSDVPTPDTTPTTTTTVITTPNTSCDGDDGGPEVFTIAPYLQQVRTDSAWVMWETIEGKGTRVDFGTDALNQWACGQREPAIVGQDPDDAETQVHAVQLTGLTPDTRYQYQVRTGETQSEVFSFLTAPDPADEKSFHLVAMSDSQRDDRHPEMFGEILDQGVAPILAIEGEASMVLFPGDLVDNGWLVDEWQNEFFAPGASLWATTPLMPAIGNHEGNTPWYFRYFMLPEEDGLAEHAWHQDYSNVRFVTLDSNGFSSDEQLAWLDRQLDEACDMPQIDFVFAQLHHPMLSELWRPGESDFTASVVTRLEAFTELCGKPSVHFFGHTHGYSRGQSAEHQHLMVNVASAGGALDRWGLQSQADYDAFTVSQDTYGFVTVHVEAGDDPSFRLTRYNRGVPEAPLNNVQSDSVTLLRYNTPPLTPVALPITCPHTLAIQGFEDDDGHTQQATQWQLDLNCSFTAPLIDQWRQDKNEYMGVDLQLNDDLLDEALPDLLNTVASDPNYAGEVCWRARVRDEHLGWSEWSAPRNEALPDCG
ncbi:MAG: metallophosphoesterase [Rhodobacterales bacterium]|nr:metallophosphoesterase [Rhodobacterales bacterium]